MQSLFISWLLLLVSSWAHATPLTNPQIRALLRFELSSKSPAIAILRPNADRYPEVATKRLVLVGVDFDVFDPTTAQAFADVLTQFQNENKDSHFQTLFAFDDNLTKDQAVEFKPIIKPSRIRTWVGTYCRHDNGVSRGLRWAGNGALAYNFAKLGQFGYEWYQGRSSEINVAQINILNSVVVLCNTASTQIRKAQRELRFFDPTPTEFVEDSLDKFSKSEQTIIFANSNSYEDAHAILIDRYDFISESLKDVLLAKKERRAQIQAEKMLQTEAELAQQEELRQQQITLAKEVEARKKAELEANAQRLEETRKLQEEERVRSLQARKVKAAEERAVKSASWEKSEKERLDREAELENQRRALKLEEEKNRQADLERQVQKEWEAGRNKFKKRGSL